MEEVFFATRKMMSNRIGLSIESDNLSYAWAKAFLTITQRGVSKLIPLTVTLTDLVDGKPQENAKVRTMLDETLEGLGLDSCESVSETTFPDSMWNPKLERDELFSRFNKISPALREVDKRNSNGMYFQRMIAFGPKKINQLDHIIRTYRGNNHRPTALQAAIFSPETDHTNQVRRPFPCLDHVAFTKVGDDGLHVTGYYTAQNLFEKAYGNYLGLCSLVHPQA